MYVLTFTFLTSQLIDVFGWLVDLDLYVVDWLTDLNAAYLNCLTQLNKWSADCRKLCVDLPVCSLHLVLGLHCRTPDMDRVVI